MSFRTFENILPLDRLFTQMAEADVKEIRVVLKAAEQGTVDVLKSEIDMMRMGRAYAALLTDARGPRSTRRTTAA